MTAGSLAVVPVVGIGEIGPGDSIAEAIVAAIEIEDDDVVVVAHKVVSKAEGRLVDFDGTPEQRKAIVEGEAARILRRRGELVIAETRHGLVCANAGVDFSNVPDGSAALLPADPDRSARRIRDGIERTSGRRVAVIVSDAFGRPWRRGATDVAIGLAGLVAVRDLPGELDASGRSLQTTAICVADELAAAADLVMGKVAGIPAAVIRGIDPSWFGRSSIRSDVVRDPMDDLFR